MRPEYQGACFWFDTVLLKGEKQMIHPDTELKFINEHIGHGVVATKDIPKGTIVYVKDELELVFVEGDAIASDPKYKHLIEKYSYTEPDGTKVLSWDIAKYVNHSCQSNCLSTGYGFEIAIRDIAKGEQLTDDYGMLNIEHDMDCCCGAHQCRGVIGQDDFSYCSDNWDYLVQDALSAATEVAQPLMQYVDARTRKTVAEYQSGSRVYLSVNRLRKNDDNYIGSAGTWVGSVLDMDPPDQLQ